MLNKTTVREWMNTPVLTVNADSPISAAHMMMKQNKVRRLPVVDENHRLVGLVTIGDVREASPSDATTLSIWELNYLWGQLTVGKIMTRDVVTIKPDETIFDAAKLMLDNKISGLPVVDEVGQLIGIITESDIFRMVMRLAMPETT